MRSIRESIQTQSLGELEAAYNEMLREKKAEREADRKSLVKFIKGMVIIIIAALAYCILISW